MLKVELVIAIVCVMQDLHLTEFFYRLAQDFCDYVVKNCIKRDCTYIGIYV